MAVANIVFWWYGQKNIILISMDSVKHVLEAAIGFCAWNSNLVEQWVGVFEENENLLLCFSMLHMINYIRLTFMLNYTSLFIIVIEKY